SLLHKACRVVGYHVDARYAEKDKLRVYTMWTQDAELAWDKLEEQVYTVEKRQEINLGSKYVHDCSMQKTIMLKDGRYGHWKVHMKLLVRGINDAVWIAECISRGGEEHGDGRPEVDGAYLVGEKSVYIVEDEDSATLVGENGISSVESLLHKACGVVGYHVDARYAEMEKDKLRVYVLT
ncbi:hypothetical protein IGI04_026222, partial [Brassica rapa subsp. trilocularis]